MCNTHTFAAAACVAFAQKYATKRCDILRREDVKNPLHKVVLAKYGDKIRAIYMNYQDTALLALIKRKCSNLKSVELFNISKMPKLRGLKKLHLPKGTNFSKKTFTTLINNNPQLEFFKINNIKSVFLNALDGQLDMLKELALFNIRSVNDVSKIRLSSLEKLSINATETTDCIGILQAINCNDIKVLNIDAYDFNDKCAVMIDEICAFKSLVSLRLVACAFTITTSQLHKLAAHLPHLIEFSMALPDGSPSLEDLEDEILSVVSILPNLSKLTIHLFGDDFKQFLNDLKTSIYDFHECFANISTEIDVIYSFSKVSTSEDRIFVYDTKSESVELHWMDNLNETSVQKVTRGFWTWVAAIKLVNNCKDQTFDLSTFMQSSIEHTRCLDIRSYGPITVNANLMRCPGFFPSLQTLKIHLDNHSAIDFLQKCDRHSCQHIEELWLNTKSTPSRQEAERTNDTIRILIKFENLKSLHMTSSSGEFNTKQLFSACQKLTDLQIWRE